MFLSSHIVYYGGNLLLLRRGLVLERDMGAMLLSSINNLIQYLQGALYRATWKRPSTGYLQ